MKEAAGLSHIRWYLNWGHGVANGVLMFCLFLGLLPLDRSPQVLKHTLKSLSLGPATWCVNGTPSAVPRVLHMQNQIGGPTFISTAGHMVHLLNPFLQMGLHPCAKIQPNEGWQKLIYHVALPFQLGWDWENLPCFQKGWRHWAARTFFKIATADRQGNDHPSV